MTRIRVGMLAIAVLAFLVLYSGRVVAQKHGSDAWSPWLPTDRGIAVRVQYRWRYNTYASVPGLGKYSKMIQFRNSDSKPVRITGHVWVDGKEQAIVVSTGTSPIEAYQTSMELAVIDGDAIKGIGVEIH